MRLACALDEAETRLVDRRSDRHYAPQRLPLQVLHMGHLGGLYEGSC